jgi:hypothetical protein
LYFAKCKSDSRIESIGPAGYNALNASLNQLVADFTTIDRLATIGIPTVYGELYLVTRRDTIDFQRFKPRYCLNRGTSQAVHFSFSTHITFHLGGDYALVDHPIRDCVCVYVIGN